ncbi:MAG: DNA primase [Metallibacterium scheffleri]|jgi:DNA primase|uniref:DNA primase n=1 Tax=Metallibacterium scheffleri TaxID=993689 RepID=UPI0026EAA0B8|nr:DNA primase [Metallibacterium scheffleri]MCK9366640.1 DNA primase [Metallibacterium scheffleri]
MPRIPDRFIDELLARVDIVEVIERRVPLKKAGREWTACCPFHNERSPSFFVSPQKQFFHCFGCGAHGSAIKFLMDYERMEFPDAVEELARTAGIEVPYEGGGERARDDFSELYAVLEEAARWFQRELTQSPAAQAYCARRGLDADTLQRFRIGWAPSGWDGLQRALGGNAARLQLLEQAGLLASNEQGRRYDRFRERLMIPILDRRGRVIAFGGRIISSVQPARADQAADAPARAAAAGDGPKYLNSPETALFHKGRELFALWQVRQAAGALPRVVVVEGYLDAIALHQHGLPQAVATLGTATTPEHTEMLFRTTPDVVFCFDGDRAGRSAAWRALEATLPRLRDGRQAYFLFLPEGEDPDSLVRKEGGAAFAQRLAAATPLSEYFFEHLAEDVNVATLDGRARLAERARPLLARLPDGAFRDLMQQALQARTGVSAPAPTQATPARAPARRASAVRRSLVREAIAVLLADSALAAEVAPPWTFAASSQPGVGLLIELLELARARPGISVAALLEHFTGRGEADALHKLALIEFPEAHDLRSEFLGALAQLTRQAHAERLDQLTRKLQQEGLSAPEKAELQALHGMRRHGQA